MSFDLSVDIAVVKYPREMKQEKTHGVCQEDREIKCDIMCLQSLQDGQEEKTNPGLDWESKLTLICPLCEERNHIHPFLFLLIEPQFLCCEL
jgi:hypothetical protein